MDSRDLLERATLMVTMLFSLSVHEWAHAYAAHRLGDDTAEREGRLTLNPMAHIDPIGTILLPLLGVPFGWAKPVPVNPARFDRKVSMSAGMAITAVAGPLSNLILALVCTVGAGLFWRFAPGTVVEQKGIWALLISGVQLNVALCLFNLLPIPPLDGSRIAEHALGYRHRESWAQFTRVAPFVLFAMIVASMKFGIFNRPLSAVSGALFEVVQRIATS